MRTIKTRQLPIGLGLVMLTLSSALVDAQFGELQIVEHGPHHRTWERVTVQKTGRGQMLYVTNGYVELSGGMHYQPSGPDGPWVEAREVIELFPGGAVARQAQNQVIWAPNIHSAGSVDMLAPDQQRFQSHLLGLSYLNAETGESVLIGEIQDSIGELVPPNQIIYRNCFTDIRADVRYTFTRAGIAQDIILRQKPPPPAALGLNARAEDVRLEIFTEFLQAPNPIREPAVLARELDPARRKTMVLPDFIDETLWFGATLIGSGRAFSFDDHPDGGLPAEENSAPVAKTWERIENRNFLIESVRYSAILPQLQGLPVTAAVKAGRKGQWAKGAPSRRKDVLMARFVPAAPATNAVAHESMRLASMPVAPEPGVVLDYSTTVNSSNYVFRGGSTTFVSSNIALSGTTVIEGNSTIKMARAGNCRLWINGPIDCRTDRFHPATFTVVDDQTIGEPIVGSAPTPTNYYGGHCLDLESSGTAFKLHDLRVRYQANAIYLRAGSLDLRHSQIGFGTEGIYSGTRTATVRNVLFHDLNKALTGTMNSTNFTGEHATFHRIGTLLNSGSVALTNCLLISVTNGLSWLGTNVVSSLNDAASSRRSAAPRTIWPPIAPTETQARPILIPPCWLSWLSAQLSHRWSSPIASPTSPPISRRRPSAIPVPPIWGTILTHSTLSSAKSVFPTPL